MVQGFSPSMVLSEGRINVSRDSTLVLTFPENKFTDRNLSISQSLDTGWNTLNIIDYLDVLYPEGGLTLAKIKEVFNDSSVVTFDGTLTSSTKTTDISLEIILT